MSVAKRSIFAVPSKLTPPIVRAVANAVAVAALPVVFWFSVPITRSIVLSASWYVAVIPVSVLLENIAPTVSLMTSDKSMLAEPSKLTPCMVLALARVVAVSALPVKAPTKPVAVIFPVEGLYVSVPSLSSPKLPPSTSPPAANIIALSSLVLSLSVMVTVVAIAAVPVVSWLSVPITKSKVLSLS